MKNFLKVAASFPVLIAAGLFFVWLFFRSPSLTSANLFFLSTFLLVWLLFNLPRKKYFNFKAFAIIAFYCCLAAYYFLAKNDSCKYLFLALTGVNLCLIYYIFRRFEPREQYQKQFVKILVSGLFLIALIPFVYYFSYEAAFLKDKKALKTEGEACLSKIAERKKEVSNKSILLSKDRYLQSGIAEQNLDELSIYAQNLMISNDLTYLTITDKDGVVLARAHKPKAAFDNIFQEIGKTKEDIEVGQPAFIGTGNDIPLFLAGSSQVKDQNGETIGFLFAGDIINSGFLQEIVSQKDLAAAITISGKISSSFSTNTLSQKIISYSNFSDQFSSDANRANIKSFSYDNTRLIGQSSSISTESNNIIGIIFLKHENIKESVNGRSSIVFEMIGLIVCLLFCKQKRRFQIEKSPDVAVSQSKRKKFITSLFKFMLSKFHLVKENWRARKTITDVLQAIFWNFRNKLFIFKRLVLSNYKPFLGFILIFLILMFVDGVNNTALFSRIDKGRYLALKTVNKEAQTPKIYGDFQNIHQKKGSTLSFTILAEPRGFNLTGSNVNIQFTKNILRVNDLELVDSACDRVYTKNVDNENGEINISCDFGKMTHPQAPQPIGTVNFTAINDGIANLKINDNYSYLQTEYGQSTLVVQNLAEGDKFLITKN